MGYSVNQSSGIARIFWTGEPKRGSEATEQVEGMERVSPSHREIFENLCLKLDPNSILFLLSNQHGGNGPLVPPPPPQLRQWTNHYLVLELKTLFNIVEERF